MSVSEREQTKFVHRERRMAIMIAAKAASSTEGANHDIMSLKEKQVATKQTFVFLGSLANEYPAKQDVECDSTNS